MEFKPAWAVIGRLEFNRPVSEAVAAVLVEAQVAIKQEPGCVDYCLSCDLEDKARVNAFELWASSAHFSAHVENAHSARLVTYLKQAGLVNFTMRTFIVTETIPD